MIKKSKTVLSKVNVGDNVNLLIPSVDSGRTDPRNLIGEVTDISDNGKMYSSAVKAEGMQALFTVWSHSDSLQAIGPGSQSMMFNFNNVGLARFLLSGDTRRKRSTHNRNSPPKRYFLAIEEQMWDYGPSGQNLFEGGALETSMGSMEFFMKGKNRIGGKYKKALYKGYTDSTFTKRLPSTIENRHMGYLGPVIKCAVGDNLEVVVKNNASRPYSFYPHGVSLEKRYEGAVYKTGNGSAQGLIVNPGETVTYKFYVSVQNAPTDTDPQCVTYMYHSALDLTRDVNSGLIGPLLVCRRRVLSDNDEQSNVDKEFNLLFQVVDENQSWYIDDNIREFVPNMDVGKDDTGFKDSNKMHSVNGRMYGNLEGLDMCRGDRTSWHIFSYGDDHDVHSVNFFGNNFHFSTIHKDAKASFPGSSFTAYMEPDNVGKWALVCRVNHHYHAGMKVMYNVNYCTPSRSTFGVDNYWPNISPMGRTRTFYIAAVEPEWDYAPDKRDLITGKNMSSDPTAAGYIYCRSDDMFVGSKYKKAVYREYTDGTFTRLKPRGPHEEHLGLLGPFIRAEVGDVIRIVFHNKASRSYSIHGQGMLYDKASEGADYKDFSRLTSDNKVPPGGRYTYMWLVPERSGPSSKEPRCISWMYYSASNPVKDTTAGLVGPLIICRRGTLNANGERTDVNRDFALLFSVFDENISWYSKENFKRYAPKRTNVKDKTFKTSNEMNAINGYIYGNLPGLIMNEGETIAWYILSVGSANDIHTAHFHGQTFLHRSDVVHRNDVILVVPGTFETLEMFTDNPGSWILHCHVVPHMKAGMEAIYTILPKSKNLPGRPQQRRPNQRLNEHGEPDWRTSRFLPFRAGFRTIPQYEINGRHRFPWFSRIFTRGWTPNGFPNSGRLMPMSVGF